MVKNPPSSRGDVGLVPGLGTKIPHDSGQLSPRHTERLCSKALVPQQEKPLYCTHCHKDPVQPKFKTTDIKKKKEEAWLSVFCTT